jgi:histo-blood group ABO system transferase
MIETARKYLLTNHDVEYMLWTDMPSESNYGCTLFPTEPIQWPYPTLLRYHLFLQQEEYLKKFDYLFYTDCDMRYVDTVGDEILGNGLTMAQHPMYALRRTYIPPYEPNPKSAAYIPRFGQISQDENGKTWFDPLYAAGGFQGGTTESFMTAMKSMKRGIDKDLSNNYISIWNDESHWNKYLSEHPPAVVLSPSYIYPDSMINEYYIPIWGRNYTPKLITITKKFSTSKEAGDVLREQLKNMPK